MSLQTEVKPPALYPTEVLEIIAGFPALYKYQAPDPDASTQRNPLIVCIPGAMHLARIFYGGHEGHREQDFLSYWLSKKGFATLSVSYPVETDPPIMASSVNFRISDWGYQAAAIAKKIIDKHSLALDVVLVAWSMGGRVVVPFTTSATELGLRVRQFISFAATPGISVTQLPGPLSTNTGYFHPSAHVQGFCRQLEAVDGGVVIPRETYIREYIGGTPINLPGLRLKYSGANVFVPDEITHEEDSRVFDVTNLPLVSAIYPTDILDARHALVDRASWGFLLTLKLQNLIGKHALSNAEARGQWPQLMGLVHSAPDRLSVPIAGNHFFFVGERGTRETADKVVYLLMEGSLLQNELSAWDREI